MRLYVNHKSPTYHKILCRNVQTQNLASLRQPQIPHISQKLRRLSRRKILRLYVNHKSPTYHKILCRNVQTQNIASLRQPQISHITKNVPQYVQDAKYCVSTSTANPTYHKKCAAICTRRKILRLYVNHKPHISQILRRLYRRKILRLYVNHKSPTYHKILCRNVQTQNIASLRRPQIPHITKYCADCTDAKYCVSTSTTNPTYHKILR